MKKSLFFLCSVPMILASCSNDEVIDVAQSSAAVGFSTFVNNSSRATDLDNDTFQSFDVWGVTTDPANSATGLTPVFNQQVVTKSGNDWTYSPLRYWVVGNDYRFSALAPSGLNENILTVEQNLDAETTISEAKGGLVITFNNQDAAAGVDLCYAFAKAINVTATQPMVSLEFSHMLSRVKFTFKNTFAAEGSLIRVQNIKITNATAEATINKVDGDDTWSSPEGTFGITFSTDRNNSNGLIQNTSYVPGGGSSYVTTAHQYLIPLTGETTYQLSFTVTLMNFNEINEDYEVVRAYDHLIDLPAMAYKNNCSYNFVAEINDETIDPDNTLRPIEFTATVTDWDDFNDETITFPEKNAE